MPIVYFDAPRAVAATYVSLGLGGVLRLSDNGPALRSGSGYIGGA